MTDHEATFRSRVLTNPVIVALIERLPALDLPDCWITAGAVMQTVWNALEGHAPGYGLKDYDVFYLDPDLLWEAEDRAIRRAGGALAGIEIEIAVRNQARVHLWFDERNTLHPRLTVLPRSKAA